MKNTAINSRKLTKRISILEKTVVRDAYGGSTVSFVDNGIKRWASVEDLSQSANASRQTEIGITDFTNTFKFTVRFSNTFEIKPNDNVINYMDRNFVILNVSKVGFTRVQTVIIARLETEITT